MYDPGHKCNRSGCGIVLVIDGNMNNVCTVCRVKNVDQIIIEGIEGVVVGKYHAFENYSSLI